MNHVIAHSKYDTIPHNIRFDGAGSLVWRRVGPTKGQKQWYSSQKVLFFDPAEPRSHAAI